MATIPTNHVYHRAFDPNGQESLDKLARLIHPASRVLDLGTGPGVLGRYLAETLNCVVDGVEYNPVAAAEAAPWYRRMECVDLETIDLAECFAGYQYDFIICADILEHLRQPGALLVQMIPLLAPGGRVLVSVPNVAYAGLIADLLAGEFRYRIEGLLDETHLRFFTYASLLRLLEDHGLRAVAVDATIRDVRESEFTDRSLHALAPALVRGLMGRPEALVYQFIISAAVAAEVGEVDLPPLMGPPPELRFVCQLFWRTPGAGYQEHESSVAWGRLGEERQAMALPIPPRSMPLEALRIDFADRPGLMRLYELTLHDRDGRLLWRWDAQHDSLVAQPGQQLAFANLQPLMTGLIVLLTGGDPGVELPIPVMSLMGLQDGGELRMELSWPMSLDYMALVQNCIPRRDAAAMQAALKARIAELENGDAALTAIEAELKAEATILSARKTELEVEAAALSLRKAELEAETAALTVRNTALEQQLEILQTQLSEQAVQLNSQTVQLSEQANQLIVLRSSHSWRLTAPLRICSSWLRLG